MSTDAGALEREVLKHAMQRLRSWKKEYPKGLLPWGHPQGVQNKSGWNMIRACLALEKARIKKRRAR